MTRRRRASRVVNPRKAQIAKPVNFVAPVKGWRTDVPLEAMPPDAASTLINWFPEAGYCRPRNGSNTWATGITGSVGTLAPYSGATQKLFAFSPSSCYDVSSAGAAVAQSPTVTHSHWSTANFTNSGGHWLVAVNGFDAGALYNGSTWSALTYTGPTYPLFAVASYRSRLWFLEQGTTNLWFLPTSAITGAMQAVNLGAVLKKGGLPVAVSSWTSQTASGVLMFLVIMSSEGELVVYQGSDPTDATNWSLLGTFALGYPLGGDRCLQQVGADLAIMTVDGIVPITQAIALDPAEADQTSMTKAIAPTWLQIVQSVGRATQGWELALYAPRRMAIVNVPDPATGAYQLVMNSETLAWTKFTGMAANCWASWNGGLYFGTGGAVVQADAGSSDAGTPIDCLSVGAWQRLPDGLAPKQASMIGVDAIIDQTATVFAGVSWDFKSTIPAALAVSGTGVTPSQWDSAVWDTDVWTGSTPVRLLAAAPGVGSVFAPTVRALINGNAGTPSGCTFIGGVVMLLVGQGL